MSILAVAAAWLLTYLIHSTLLFLGALLGDHLLWRARPRCAEFAWRAAMLVPLCTAALPLLSAPNGGDGESAVEHGWARAAWLIDIPPTAEPLDANAARPGDGAVLAGEQPAARAGTDVRGIVGAGFALIVVIGAAGCLRDRLRTRRLLAGRRRLVRGPVVADLDAVRRDDLPAVELWECPRLEVPVAAGCWRPGIGVPRRFARRLDSAARRAALAHELGHVAGRDPAWLAFLGAITRLLWVQPLNRLALRRLADLAEWRADAWATSRTGDPAGLARCLAEVAGWLERTPCCATPALAARRPSQLRSRVVRLLDGSIATPEPRRWPVVLIVVTASVCITWSAPGVAPARVGDPAPAIRSAESLPQILRDVANELELVEDSIRLMRARHGAGADAVRELELLERQAATLRLRLTAVERILES